MTETDVVTEFQITISSSIEDIKKRIDAWQVEQEKTEQVPTFDHKVKLVELHDYVEDMKQSLRLPFYLKLCECADGVFRIIMSRYPLYSGRGELVADGRTDKIYVETKTQSIIQHTFVWTSKNKQGGWIGTIDLEIYLKWYELPPKRAWLLGIKAPQLKIAEIHFVCLSDAVVEHTNKEINAAYTLHVPTGRDIEAVPHIMDCMLSERIIHLTDLAVGEVSNVREEFRWKDENRENRFMARMQTMAADLAATRKMHQTSLGSKLVSLFPKSAMGLLRLIILIAGTYLLLGLVLSALFGIQIPGIAWAPAEPADPGGDTDAEPYEPLMLILVLLRGLL